MRSCLAAAILVGLVLVGVPTSLQAQDLDEETLTRRLEQLTRNPVIRELIRRSQPGLTNHQKRVLGDAIDAMAEAEVDKNLDLMGLTKAGSVYARRERLKAALGIEALPTLPPPPGTPKIAIENASEGEFMSGEDDDRGLLKLYGRIRVRLPGGIFYADRVVVDTNRQEIYGEGNVEYIGANNDTEIRAERIIYNQKLQNGIIYNASGYQSPVHFIGKNLTQINTDRYSASHVYFTGCTAEQPHYNFTAKRLWIYDDNKIFAVGVLYHVGGVPLLPLPFLFASDWGTGIIAQAGVSDLQGWFIQTTYQFGVPDAIYSVWEPQAYRFKLDYYENTGEAFGAELYKFSPNLNYILDLGVARYRRYGIAGDIRETDNLAITNQVQRCNGTPGQPGYYCTVGEDFEKWYKIFAIVNYRSQNLRDNVVRNVNLRYEDYSHQLYEYEFGGRYQPASTIPALYENSEAGRGLIRNTTNWNLVYNEQRDDLSIRVEATRNNLWKSTVSTFDDSEYQPVNDVIPAVDLTKRWNLGRVPYLEVPIYWDHNLHVDLEKQYSDGNEFQNLNNNEYRTGFRSFVSFFPYVTFAPSVGYGAQKTVPEYRGTDASAEAALERESRKNSYQYLYTEDQLTFGPDVLFLRTTYRYKKSFKEEQNDTPVVNTTGFDGSQKVNETEVSLEFNPLINTTFSITSVYDHRQFEQPVKNGERWYYPVFRSEIFFDFLNWFRPERENLLTRNKVHFLGLGLTNDYVYDPIQKRDHSNVFGLSYQMGGFDLWFLKRLRYLELTYYWYHVYYNPELDHMRFAFKTDLQLWSWGYLEMELESRATDIGRYSSGSKNDEGEDDYVPFYKDVYNGTGLAGPEKRQSSVFNVAFYRTALILDLHDWEYRIGYELEQRTVFGGVNTVDVVNFYDNRVFFSATLLRFDLGGVSDQPSRFIVNRQQVRSSDIARTPIGATRIR